MVETMDASEGQRATHRRASVALAAVLAAAVCGGGAALATGSTEPQQPAGAPPTLEPGDPIPGEILVRLRGQRSERIIELPEGVAEEDAIRALERNPEVADASRDFVVGVAAADDPGESGVPGGWRDDQWHLLATAGGINAPPAWKKMSADGKRFGRYSARKRGAIVAVVDTGVAYRYAKGGRYRRSPDLAKGLFVKGKDLVDGGKPLDEYGHGTHMAGTIAGSVRNGRGVRGIAPGARLMPIRVLDKFGFGRTSVVAEGVRWAARRGARIINISIEYGSVPSCKSIPALCRAIKQATNKGAVVVAAAGNNGRRPVPLPSKTIVVGGATLRGCLGAYSNRGGAIDLLGPGGGRDAKRSKPGCDPRSSETPGIVQLTVVPRRGRYDRFAYPRTVGTSSAAAHASGVIALVLAARTIGRKPRAGAILKHLQRTGRPAVGLPPNSGSPPLLDAPGAVGAG